MRQVQKVYYVRILRLQSLKNKNYMACFEGTAASRMIENFIFDDCVIRFNKSGTK